MIPKKRNYNALKANCVKDLVPENNNFPDINTSFKKLKLTDHNTIFSKNIKIKNPNISEEQKNENPFSNSETTKIESEYDKINGLLRNSYYEYRYYKKIFSKSENSKEKNNNFIEKEDKELSKNIFEFYQDEKNRLFEARIESGNKNIELE